MKNAFKTFAVLVSVVTVVVLAFDLRLVAEARSVLGRTYVDPLPTDYELARAAIRGVVYDFSPSDRRLAWAAIRGVVNSLNDPHTEFSPPPKRLKSGRSRSPSPVMGIFGDTGVYYRNQHSYLAVIGIAEGSPADKAGIRWGDSIVAVAPHGGEWRDISDLSLSERKIHLAGLPGTKVWFKVERYSHVEWEALREVFVLELERAPVEREVPLAYGCLMTDNVGYLRLSNFRRDKRFGFIIPFLTRLNTLMSQGAEVLILDLRDNPGGILRNARSVAGKFFPEGTLVARWIFPGGRHAVVLAHPITPALEVPLVVLIDGETASAAEVFAGAIQDHGRGVLVGTNTFGKGFSLESISLSDGSRLRIRSGLWETPSGRNVSGVGLTPDIAVPMPEEPDGTDLQLERAFKCALTLVEGRECQQ